MHMNRVDSLGGGSFPTLEILVSIFFTFHPKFSDFHVSKWRKGQLEVHIGSVWPLLGTGLGRYVLRPKYGLLIGRDRIAPTIYLETVTI